MSTRQRGQIGEQKMTDILLERIFADIPPLINVGVDYFGPTDIRKG